MSQHDLEVSSRTIADDEIDLVQLLLVLLKRKYLISGVFVLCIAIGGGYAFLRSTVYEYFTTIEIGSTIKNMETGDIEPIESAEEALQKVKAAYVPLSSKNQSEENIKVSAVSPKGSRLVILKSSGTEVSAKAHEIIHDKIATAVQDDHSRAVQAVRQQLESRIARLKTDLDKMLSVDLLGIKMKDLQENVLQEKRNLSSLTDEENVHKVSSSIALNNLESAFLDTSDNQRIELIGLQDKVAKENANLANLVDQKNALEEQKELLVQEKKLISAQVETLNKTLSAIGQKRLDAPGEVDNPASALTLMMIENQLEQYRARKENLELRLEVNL